MTPVFWLIAGPNGSGKSTLVSSGILQRLAAASGAHTAFPIINPDARRREIEHASPHPDMEAAHWADEELVRRIKARESFARETVLSTDRLFPHLRAAQAEGFRIVCIFVVLRDPKLSVARVKARAKLGGHPVPEEKVIKRWVAAVKNIPVVCALSDQFLLFENSQIGRGPELLLERNAGKITINPTLHAMLKDKELNPTLKTALLTVLSP